MSKNSWSKVRSDRRLELRIFEVKIDPARPWNTPIDNIPINNVTAIINRKSACTLTLCSSSLPSLCIYNFSISPWFMPISGQADPVIIVAINSRISQCVYDFDIVIIRKQMFLRDLGFSSCFEFFSACFNGFAYSKFSSLWDGVISGFISLFSRPTWRLISE